MKLSPFLNMYVDYCFQFTSGVQALDQARRKRPQLERYIAQAENQIRTANLMQRGPAAGGVVSLFDYLIKPVQRLCQYPLLFRQIAKEMQLLAEPEGGAAAGQRKKSVRFELGEGGGGDGEAWPRGGIAKAKLVLQVLHRQQQRAVACSQPQGQGRRHATHGSPYWQFRRSVNPGGNLSWRSVSFGSSLY